MTVGTVICNEHNASALETTFECFVNPDGCPQKFSGATTVSVGVSITGSTVVLSGSGQVSVSVSFPNPDGCTVEEYVSRTRCTLSDGAAPIGEPGTWLGTRIETCPEFVMAECTSQTKVMPITIPQAGIIALNAALDQLPGGAIVPDIPFGIEFPVNGNYCLPDEDTAGDEYCPGILGEGSTYEVPDADCVSSP